MEVQIRELKIMFERGGLSIAKEEDFWNICNFLGFLIFVNNLRHHDSYQYLDTVLMFARKDSTDYRQVDFFEFSNKLRSLFLFYFDFFHSKGFRLNIKEKKVLVARRIRKKKILNITVIVNSYRFPKKRLLVQPFTISISDYKRADFANIDFEDFFLAEIYRFMFFMHVLLYSDNIMQALGEYEEIYGYTNSAIDPNEGELNGGIGLICVNFFVALHQDIEIAPINYENLTEIPFALRIQPNTNEPNWFFPFYKHMNFTRIAQYFSYRLIASPQNNIKSFIVDSVSYELFKIEFGIRGEEVGNFEASGIDIKKGEGKVEGMNIQDYVNNFVSSINFKEEILSSFKWFANDLTTLFARIQSEFIRLKHVKRIDHELYQKLLANEALAIQLQRRVSTFIRSLKKRNLNLELNKNNSAILDEARLITNELNSISSQQLVYKDAKVLFFLNDVFRAFQNISDLTSHFQHKKGRPKKDEDIT